MGMFKSATTAAQPAKKLMAAKKIAPAKAAVARNARDDDDGDEEDGDGIAVTSGWGGAQKMKAEFSGFANSLKMKEETIVIRFGEDAPYANVATHWVKREGRQSFICHGPKTCPLCALGDRPRVQYCFNVFQLTDSEPAHWSWDVGVKVLAKIEKRAKDPKTGPLTKMYYELERTGLTKDNTDYTLKVLRRESDITEVYPDLVIPTASEIAKLVKTGYTTDDVKKQRASLKEMEELAAELSGDDYDPDNDDD